MPDASHTSFVRHLSIASADAMTPLPVYGMRNVSSAPCTVPSSPKRPCSAMNTRAKPSSLQREDVLLRGIERVRVDAATAQRCEHGVAGEERDLALGGRSAHQHATFPNSLHAASPTIRTSGSSSTPVVARTTSRTCAISASMSAARAVALRIHDEVRVLLRDARVADREALEAAGLDQPRRMVAGRVAEHAARVRHRQRLRRDALREQLANPRPRGLRVAGREPEPRRDEDRVQRRSVVLA